ncbi:MAG: hypothetical protein ABI678_27705, partial [Kofleriaceae bacterium]
KTAEELARLERQLAEAHDKLTQLGEERTMLLSELRAARGDADAAKLRAIIPAAYTEDPEVTASGPQVSRLEATTGENVELKKQLAAAHADLERLKKKAGDKSGPVDDGELRKVREQAATAQAELERVRVKTTADIRALEDQIRDLQQQPPQRRTAERDTTSDTNRTGPAAPDGIVENLGVLEEAIDSLRANMRAASDETAMMDQTAAVIAVASAVSSAAEHVERARDALRVLTGMVTKS